MIPVRNLFRKKLNLSFLSLVFGNHQKNEGNSEDALQVSKMFISTIIVKIIMKNNNKSKNYSNKLNNIPASLAVLAHSLTHLFIMLKNHKTYLKNLAL